MDQHKGKTVRITIDGNDNYQLDGDVIGDSTTFFTSAGGLGGTCGGRDVRRSPFRSSATVGS
jgi:hypothetical protein